MGEAGHWGIVLDYPKYNLSLQLLGILFRCANMLACDYWMCCAREVDKGEKQVALTSLLLGKSLEMLRLIII